jgi:hypothetical protein
MHLEPIGRVCIRTPDSAPCGRVSFGLYEGEIYRSCGAKLNGDEVRVRYEKWLVDSLIRYRRCKDNDARRATCGPAEPLAVAVLW